MVICFRQALRRRKRRKIVLLLAHALDLHTAKTGVTVLQTIPNHNRCCHVRTMCKQGQSEEALEVLKTVEHPVDSFTYISLLQGCIKKKALSDGKLVHAHIAERGFMAHRIVRNTLVDMYAKCGSLVDARRVFDQMPERDVFSWTFIISAHARHGLAEEALTLYRQMKQTGIQPDQFTFTSVFPACATLAAVEEVHGDIIVHGFQFDVFVATALVDLYAKCGRIEKARDLFDKMPQRNAVSWTALIAGYAHNGDVDEALRLFYEMAERNVVSWTVMIAGCVQNGYNEEALEIFHEMQLTGVKPSLKTFASILPACANLSALEQGIRIHEEIIRCGVQLDAFVESALIDMYGKCGSVEKARDVFDKMHQHNVVLWNAMIACYAQNGYFEEALNLYKQMPLAAVRPNLKTFATALSACADLTDIEHGIEIHEEIIRNGFEFDVFVGSALINMYVKCGSIEKAHDLFAKMPEQNIVSWTAMAAGYAMCGHVQEALTIFERMPGRDMVAWNAMIAGFVESGNVDEAHKLFQDMPIRNMVSWTIMIAGYAQCGHVDEALKLFLKLPQKNTVTWTAMIAGYSQNGNNQEAVNLFRQMQTAGVKPNSKTFASVMSACANLASLEHGMEIHREIIRSGFQIDVFLESALIDMYAKCGSIEKARHVFNKIVHPNVGSWNAMIAGYAMHGCGSDALELFEQMQQSGVKLNHITLIGVLTACSHAGLVSQGRKYFDCMSEYYHITPTIEHYGCMVDLLGRAGLLNEAKDFIDKMPITPNSMVWGSLLGACRLHNDTELGANVAEHLFELDSKDATPYVVLSNIYAAAGMWDGMEKVRKMMEDNDIKRMPGCSWIEVNKKVHGFLVGTSCP